MLGRNCHNPAGPLSVAYERSRAVSPFDADALSVAAIDLASAGIDALYAIATAAEQPQPQLSAALSKAAIVAAPDSVSAKAEPVCGSDGGTKPNAVRSTGGNDPLRRVRGKSRYFVASTTFVWVPARGRERRRGARGRWRGVRE